MREGFGGGGRETEEFESEERRGEEESGGGHGASGTGRLGAEQVWESVRGINMQIDCG